MILSEALQKNGYAVSFGELVSFHDVPCMPGVRCWASTQIQLKFWTPKYDCTPVPRCMKLSSTKRWPWSFRGSCCRRAPEPLLLDTAQRCVKKQGSLFCVLSVGLCSFDIEKSKSDWKWWEVLMRSPIVQSVGSGSKEFASGKLVLWTQKPCHAETKQPTSALVFARAGTLHHVSPFAAPSDRVVDFVGSCFSLVYVSSANPETVPM